MEDMDLQNPLFMDALKELANIGTGHAVTALSQLLGKFVNITVPEVHVVGLGKVADTLGDAGEEVSVAYVGYHGELDGGAMVVFDRDSTSKLVRALVGTEMGLEDPMAASVVQEVGNILVATFVSALAQFFGDIIYPEPPAVAMDMLGAILNVLLSEVGQHADYIIVAKTNISIEDASIRGWLINVPTPQSFQRIVGKLGI